MDKYSSSVKILLDRETKATASTYFLTVYFPVKNFTKKQIAQRLESLILKEFRSHPALKKKGWLHQGVVENILKKASLVKSSGKGLAIFYKFTSKKLSKQTKPAISARGQITIFLLQRTPEKEAYLGKGFDLDQLIWLDTTKSEAAVININQQKATVYLAEQNSLELIFKEKNPFIKEKEVEYLGRYHKAGLQSKTKKGGGYFGVDKEKIAAQKDEEDKKFLTKVKRIIKRKGPFRRGFDYLLLFHSSDFEGVANQFIKNAPKYFTGAKIKAIKKYYQRTDFLRKRVFEELSRLQIKEQKKKLTEAQQRRDLYAKGWKNVLKASRLMKIETLFIKPTLKKEGYLQKQSFAYLYPVKNSRKVRNIAPWLVKSVIYGGGDIVVLRKNDSLPEIAARLRY